VVAEAGTNVELDGVPLAGWVDVGTTAYQATRVAVTPGAHRPEAPGGERFSITAYNYAQYTSYLYPAGLNLLR
jgi:hypothetical protein